MTRAFELIVVGGSAGAIDALREAGNLGSAQHSRARALRRDDPRATEAAFRIRHTHPPGRRLGPMRMRCGAKQR